MFNTLSPLIFFLFLWILLFTKNNLKINNNILYIILFIYLLLWISSYFSLISNVSIFWWIDKWHGFIFLNNLILFFIITYYIISNYNKKILLNSSVIITTLITIIWIKEYYLPSYNYWDLWNRLLATLWHPNYVSAIYILIFPYLISLLRNFQSYKKYLISFLIILFLFWLLLTKSYIAIFLIFSYLGYEIFWKNKKKLFSWLTIFILILWWVFIFKYFPEKLNSLISRFYIWETTLKIILSDVKIFFFWIWWENLKLLFDNYKSTELYLYENIWFNADRPHNIFLNLWVHYGVVMFTLSIYWFYKLIKTSKKQKHWSYYSLLLIIIFWCFNFPNILWYLIFIIVLNYYLITNYKSNKKSNHILQNCLITSLLIISLLGTYYSAKSYISQTHIKQDNYSQAVKIFPYYWEYHYNNLDFDSWLQADNNFKTEKYYLYKLYFSFEKIPECDTLVQYYPSIENYLYCGSLIESKFWIDKALTYYKVATNKMPDIWNKNSKYLQNKYLNKIINPERILHSKFSNLQEILNKLNIK